MVIAAAPTSPLVRSPMERRKISLTTGTRLVREWRGVTYTVLVHTDGSNGTAGAYRSLTIVAREITGAQGVAGAAFRRDDLRTARRVAAAASGVAAHAVVP